MAIWSGLGAGARAGIVAVAAVSLATVGWFTVSGRPDVPAQQTGIVPTGEAEAVLPVAVPDERVAVEVEAATVPTPPPVAPVAPKFDLVRVEADGLATIAGQAAPGSTVSLRIDGAEVITAPADGQGNFVVITSLPASLVPRLLSLAMTTVNGETVVGPDTVALAPTAAPVAVAQVEPVAVPDVAEAAAPEAAPEAVPEAAPEAAPEATVEAIVEPAVEPPAPAALLVTETGVQVLQTGDITAPGLDIAVSVDTITYDPAGDVILGGRGAGGEFLRLYLDGSEITTVQIGESGQWNTVLAAVLPGIYTLRADQIGADGKVTSRFETPFKRETLQALADVAAPVAVAKPAPVAPIPEPTPALPAPAEKTPALAEAAPPEPAATDPAAGAIAPLPELASVLAPDLALTPEPAVEPVQPAPTPAAVAVADAAPAPPAPVSITVQPGFTLWGIAQQQMGAGVMYVQLFEANKDKIRDPDLIYPGQVFTMPGAN